MPIRITGLNSGLDTEALVSELVSAYRTKTQKYTKAQTKLSWKQNIWASLNTKVSSFYSKITNLKYSSAYNLKKALISDATKATVSASSSAVNGTYSLKIKQTAKTGYLTGAQLKKSVTGSTKLADLGYTGSNGTISVTSKGKVTDITVDGNTTVDDFVNKLNEAGVKASFDSTYHRFYVAASDTGVENDFSLTGSDLGGLNALYAMGLSVESTANTEAFQDIGKYAMNTAGTQYFVLDSDGNYTYNADGSYKTNGTYDAGKTKDAIDNILNQLKADSATVTTKTAQIAYANAYKVIRDANGSLLAATDASGNPYTQDDVDLMQTLMLENDLSNVFVDQNGNIYDKLSDGTYNKRGAADADKNYNQDKLDAEGIKLETGVLKLTELEKAAGFAEKNEADDGTITYVVNEEAVNAYKSGLTTVAAYEDDAANAAEVSAVQAAYASGTLDAEVSAWETQIENANRFIAEHSIWDNGSYTADTALNKISNAAGILDGSIQIQFNNDPNTGASRVNGEDATIILNNASYTSSSNTFSINGLTISALAATGTNPEDEVTITVDTNTQGLYDKIKDFLKDYNELINEFTKLYNADVAKGFEPLTNEEKDAMSDTEIEEWEKKIKDSLLRRDDSLSSLINSMTGSMMKSFQINGKSYSLASFGIKTLGVLNAKDNEHNAYHIDGDSEDSVVAGNADKLMAMLSSDPDTVVEFMKQLTTGLYDTINKKMQSSSLSSFNKVYNDKQMAREYSDYTTTIKKWDEKLKAMEDSYFKKFAAMESALAKLQSQQSSLASLLGS